MRLLTKHQDISDFISCNNEEFTPMTLKECLLRFLSQYNVEKSDVIKRSGLNQIYAYQIFAGTKKPSRDKLIALMFGYMLTLDDGNMMLKAAGLSGLYPRDKRDAVIIWGLKNELDINEVDDLLFEIKEETINRYI
jgi:hypothetical protein